MTDPEPNDRRSRFADGLDAGDFLELVLNLAWETICFILECLAAL